MSVDVEIPYYYKDLSVDASLRSWRVRLRGFTFAYFTICMATGGLADVIFRIPPRYACNGSHIFGVIVLFWDMFLFVLFSICIAYRFWTYPRALLTMARHPAESSYVCAFAQAISVLLTVIAEFGIPMAGPWLADTLVILFFVQIGFVVFITVMLPLVQFDSRENNLENMPTSWLLLPTVATYIATLGTTLATRVAPSRGIYIFWTSYAIFGIGYFLAIFYFSLWIVRQVKGGLFKDSYIFSPFMMVGTAAYAAGGFLAFGHASKTVFAMYDTGSDSLSIRTFQVLHLCMGMLWYGLAWWTFLTSIAMTVTVFCRQGLKAVSPGLGSIWSLQFPTTGLIVVTWDVARNISPSETVSGIRWLDIVGLVLLFIWVLGYVLAAYFTVANIYQGKLLWMAKDDNKPTLGYEGEFEKNFEYAKQS